MNPSDVPERVRKRFWSRVAVRSEDECWPFRLSLGSHGYGQIGWTDEAGQNYMVLAHRLAWVLTVGLIPDDLTIDHICRNRRCCNPAHLRLLPNTENARDNGNARKTHCPAGHPYNEENTYVQPSNGGRRCRACARDRDRQRNAS